MTITYNIQNVTPNLVHTIMLRKFFQMVFMGNDRRSLRIYTATVIGASQEEPRSPGEGSEKFISNIGAIPDFRMKFQFQVGNSDNNEIESIHHEDLTESDNGFLNEIDCIRKVWGKDCEIIVDDQSKLLNKLLETQKGSASPQGENEKYSANLSKYKLLWTEQTKNGDQRQNLTSLSIHGEYKESQESSASSPRDDVAKQSAYSIGVPSGVQLPKGVELVNWVRTTIRFKFEIDDNNLNYTIKRSLQLNTVTTVWAPDFTWYFSPVVKSYIDNHNSIVEVKWGQNSGENTCTCPIQKKKVFIPNDKFQNSIDAVPNKMTVDFHHWTEERIRLRQKYRLAVKEILPSEVTFNNLNEINIYLDTADEHSRGNRQFITSILISFALAFGIDSTRLKEVAPYFVQCMPADVLWLVLLVIFSLTLINTPVAQSDPARGRTVHDYLVKHARGIRKTALVSAMIWVFSIFVVLRIDAITSIIAAISGIIVAIMRASYVFVLGINILYLYLWKEQTGGRLWANLLGKDIL